MSRRRALMAAAGGGAIPTEGLVFHMSFRDSIELAETGQYFSGDDCYLADDAQLGRKVGHISEDRALVWDSGDLPPIGDSPFTVAGLFKLLRSGGFDICPLIVWGSVPNDPTVAAIRYDDGQVCLSAWGDNHCGWTPIDMEKWYHLCGVYDGAGHPKFYVDGRLVGTENFHFDIGGDGEEMNFSFSSFWSDEQAEFRIANARIYDRALSADEVKALAKEK